MSNNENKSKSVLKDEAGKHDILVYSFITSLYKNVLKNLLKK